jgi:putative DNA primase/helicase
MKYAKREKIATLNIALTERPEEREEDWTIQHFGQITSQPVRWLWPGYLALGKLSTFSGEPGSGKSLIALDAAARLTTGRDWPDGQRNEFPPSDVMVLTIEEGAEDTVKPRFLAAGGDPSRLHRIVRNGRAAFFKIDEDRERLTSALKGAGIKLMICDPLIDFVSGEQNRDSDVREVLNQLVDLAQEIDFAAGGINHLNKKSDLAAMHRVAGARGWTSVARINYLVHRTNSSLYYRPPRL